MNVIDDAYATYKLLATEFEKRGYTVTTARDNQNRLTVTYSHPMGKSWQVIAKKISYPFTSLDTALLFDHKSQSYAYAAAHGVSVPDTYFIGENQQVDGQKIAALLERHGKVIVKPENSSLSRGLSLNLTNVSSVKEAIKKAQVVKPGILIQEQVIGEEIRFMILKGKIKAALLRRTARVIGDGTSTVARLIELENVARQTLVFPYITYPQLTPAIINESYFNDQTVLPEGKVLELNHATMIKNGCSVYNVLEEVHPSYIETIEQLVKDIDTQFLVCDVFLQDFTVPQAHNNYWFIEFNTSPVLKLCYGCRDGRMFDVVPQLVTLIDEALSRG